MESETALVRTDCTVELNAVALVYVNLTVVVNPRNAEADCSLGLNESLKQACLLVFGVLVENGCQGLKYFCGCLMELGLAGVALDKICKNVLYVL